MPDLKRIKLLIITKVEYLYLFRFHLLNRGVDLFRGQAIVKRRIDEESMIVSMVVRAITFCLMYKISTYLYQV